MKSKYQGIIFITISALCFAFMNLFVKLSGDLPVMQKAFFRNAVAAVFSLVMLLRHPSSFKTIKGNFGWVALRCVAGTAGLICNFYAIDNLNIADASILNKLSPFFAIIFSFIFLKEKPNKIEWIAVLIAFGGAMFVIKPSFSMQVIPGLAGFAGGLGAGFAYTFLRKATSNGTNKNLVIFCFSTFSCAVTLPFMIIGFKPMEWWQTLYLLLAGLSATGGQVFITAAYSKCPAKEISVFDYSIVLFSAMLGLIFLEQIPDVFSYIGYAIIIGVAVFKWLYTLNKDKKATKLNNRDRYYGIIDEQNRALLLSEPEPPADGKSKEKYTN